jgi:hypothetical protein
MLYVSYSAEVEIIVKGDLEIVTLEIPVKSGVSMMRKRKFLVCTTECFLDRNDELLIFGVNRCLLVRTVSVPTPSAAAELYAPKYEFSSLPVYRGRVNILY